MKRRFVRTLKLASVVMLVICFSADAFADIKKTIVIIGGTKNIGKEIALKFASSGWNVWVTSRDDYSDDDLNQHNINVLKLDVLNHDDIKMTINDIYNTDGHIDVLVNNAGYGLLGASETVTIEQARKQFDVNFYGAVCATQEVLPLMRNQGRGHIINISSTSGVRAVPGLGMYAASKMALEGFSEALAAEVAKWNIKVSVVQPATVRNAWVDNCVYGDKNITPEYSVLSDNLSKTLRKRLERGQDQTEIGQLVFDIVNSNDSSFRYQTSVQAYDIAKDVYVDTTGNDMRNKMISFSDDLYRADK